MNENGRQPKRRGSGLVRTLLDGRYPRFCPARIAHHLTAEPRDRPAITSLLLPAVLDVLCRGDADPEADAARQEARAAPFGEKSGRQDFSNQFKSIAALRACSTSSKREASKVSARFDNFERSIVVI